MTSIVSIIYVTGFAVFCSINGILSIDRFIDKSRRILSSFIGRSVIIVGRRRLRSPGIIHGIDNQRLQHTSHLLILQRRAFCGLRRIFERGRFWSYRDIETPRRASQNLFRTLFCNSLLFVNFFQGFHIVGYAHY
uniref:Uncharacterized protein n=1 Tax=Cacopsylla melanoneura TaxID=428564 RepID=A0A8D9A9F5_9HEMI